MTSADAATGPNGLVAYQCTVEGGLDSGICVLDPSAPPGTEPTVVVGGDFAANPDWSPDGSKIVFDSFLSTNQPNIHVVNADGTGITRISATPCCERDFQPVWSPDGSRIAFVSTRDGDGEYEIYVMGSEGEIVGAPAVRLTNNPAAEFGQGIQDWQPAWSPDSTKLAFVSNRDPSNRDACDVYVMDAVDADDDGNGDNLTRLTFDNIFDCDLMGPAWSPTGAQLAFTSTRSNDYEIWVMNADGTNLVNMTQFPGQDFDAGWSPDGTQVTFVSGRDGDYEIFSTPAPPVSGASAVTFAAAAAPPVTQLTNNSTADAQPDWGVRTGGGAGPFNLTVARGHGRRDRALDPRGHHVRHRLQRDVRSRHGRHLEGDAGSRVDVHGMVGRVLGNGVVRPNDGRRQVGDRNVRWTGAGWLHADGGEGRDRRRERGVYPCRHRLRRRL